MSLLKTFSVARMAWYSRYCFVAVLLSSSLLVDVDAAEPQWIWSTPAAAQEAESREIWFRKSFDVQQPESLAIEITCDNSYLLFVNGRQVGSGNQWSQPTRYRISGPLEDGKNVIAVHAANSEAGPAGLAARVVLNSSDGKTHALSTDRSWLWHAKPPRNWKSVDLATDDWQAAAELGAYPTSAPWGSGLQPVVDKEITLKQNNQMPRGDFQFEDGDRITFLGGTSIERLQEFGYLETLISARHPRKNLTFRNLGWSGDDVTGIARAVFGSTTDGYHRLEQDLILTDPTVVIVGYGSNEAFAGEAGLDDFLAGLEQLLTTIGETGAKILLISPTRLEYVGPPLPDPVEQNARLLMYRKAMEQFAAEQQIGFIDFYQPLGDQAISQTVRPAIRDRLTDNGMHLNAYGHWRTAPLLAKKLKVPQGVWEMDCDLGNQTFQATGTLVSQIAFNDQLQFTSLDDFLPYCPPPQHSPRGADLIAPHDRLKITGLAEGHWGLQIDEQPTILATAEEWSQGVFINRANYLDQSEKLRQAIRAKNQLFFHRYRPQNETYLFLFRKHEQGNNAIEIPQFDRLISEKEAEIAQLKQPVAHHYRLAKVDVPAATEGGNQAESTESESTESESNQREISEATRQP
jgi:lysophospholipase L1-like esterase